MRTAVTLTIALLTLGCAARTGVPTTVELSTIATSSYAADDTGRKAVLVTSESEYTRRWTELIGSAPPPKADFSSGVVVFLLAGARRTGGYAVVPLSVDVASDGRATVHARVDEPGSGAIVTQALTSPYAVVFLSSRIVTSVEWPEER
jgi:hypothetical protein